MTPPPITIRASSTPQYQDCARRTACRILPSQIAEWGFQLHETPRNIGAVVGTASHAGVAYLLNVKKDTGVVRCDSETNDRSEAAFKKEAAFGVDWDEITPREDVGLRQVNRIVALYSVTVAVKAKPVAIEQKLTLTTKAGNTVQGTPDLHTDAVRDLKTGKFQGGNIVQYGTYSLLLRGNGGSVSYVVEDYFRRVAIKDQQPAPRETIYEAQIAEHAAAATIRRIERDYAEFMETGNPAAFPANPNSILCGTRFCPAHGTDFCKEHRK